MDVSSVTLGFLVPSVSEALAWYRRVFELGEPDLAPAEGVVEFKLGPVWLQLCEDRDDRDERPDSANPARRDGGSAVIARFGVPDVGREHARLSALGIDVGEVVHVPGAVDYIDVRDPYGNTLSLYSELA